MTALRQRMIRDMQMRNFAASTQKNYQFAVAQLAEHYHRPPDQITGEEIQDYLVYLLVNRRRALGSIHTIVTSLRFFYTVTLGWDAQRFPLPPLKYGSRLPDILSAQELERLFAAAPEGKPRLVLMTAYSGGLRVSEVIHLKVHDIQSDRMMIRVEQGKGRKDRYTLLSPRLLQELRAYWRSSRPTLWLFPGREWDEPLCIRMAQRFYAAALKGAGLHRRGGIHSLRHCFATHLLEAGVDVRTIQLLMGHRSILSTMRYLQVTRKTLEGTPNPLDVLTIPTSAPPA